MGDRHHRSIVKALSWRALASLTTMSIVFVFTGEALLSLGVGFVEVFSKLALYYLHERAWNGINWGRSP